MINEMTVPEYNEVVKQEEKPECFGQATTCALDCGADTMRKCGQMVTDNSKQDSLCPDSCEKETEEENKEAEICVSPATMTVEQWEDALECNCMVEDVKPSQVGKYDAIVKPVVDLLERKNMDYDNSYDLLRSEFGEIAFLIRIADKYNRLKALAKRPALVDETAKDTIMDIIGYSVLELAYREENR